MRLLIVQHEESGGPGSLAAPLRERGADLDVWWPALDDRAPAAVAYDGIVALGGVMHPDQDAEHPWLETERALLREALAAGVPTLGICLGSQLLAQAADAPAGPIARPEIGWFPLELTREARLDPVLGGLPDGLRAFEWHHYGFEPPVGAVLLARTQRAPQAFRLSEAAWGLQFHIEVDAATLADWTRDGHPELERLAGGAEAVRRATGKYLAPYLGYARDLADRFADQAERRAETRRLVPASA